jgi:Spy/CpxP family protein refolding chaperone
MTRCAYLAALQWSHPESTGGNRKEQIMKRMHKILAATVGAAALVAVTAVMAAPDGGFGGCDGTGPGAFGGGHAGWMHGGAGPGMMGGYGGYGPGAGMMGGYGPGGYGRGPGMMGGYGGGGYWGLDLSAEQRQKIEQIQDETAKARWQLMGTMHQQGYRMNGIYGPGALDEQEASKAFQAMTETRKAMFDLSLGARKRIEAVLTKEQIEQLRKQWGNR